MTTYPRLWCSVSPRTHLRVTNLAASESLSVSRMTAALLLEGLDARLRERERVQREMAGTRALGSALEEPEA